LLTLLLFYRDYSLFTFNYFEGNLHDFKTLSYLGHRPQTFVVLYNEYGCIGFMNVNIRLYMIDIAAQAQIIYLKEVP
jgi:hypothetical protein